jgi:hypothetical protein
MTEYDDDLKQVAWQSYWEGYKLGKGVESYKPIDKETAKSRFERFWRRSTNE